MYSLIVFVFLTMFAIIIGLFNSYRNMVKQYNLQLGLNRKIMTVVEKRAQLLDENIQW